MENIIKVAENKKEPKQKFAESKVVIENRLKLSITGVEKIISASENEIMAKVAGDKMCILGKDLTVSRLDVEQGVLDLTGEVNSIKYSGTVAQKGFLKRIFK